ncbi:hypothetical protein GF385_04120 [Candidatus Dependentiae bacterium]|nr:hypothetical protein [Candidatus Dependentiae bacterium]
MKKILLTSAFLLLSIVFIKPIDIFSGGVNAMRYAEGLNSLEKAMKGDKSGFIDLIAIAKDKLKDVDFSELSRKHVDNIISFVKSGMGNRNDKIRMAIKDFAMELEPKMRELANKKPATFMRLYNELRSMMGRDVISYPVVKM